MAGITARAAAVVLAAVATMLLLGPAPAAAKEKLSLGFVQCQGTAQTQPTCVLECASCVAQFLPPSRTCEQLCDQDIYPLTGEPYKNKQGTAPRCQAWCKKIKNKDPVPVFCQGVCNAANDLVGGKSKNIRATKSF